MSSVVTQQQWEQYWSSPAAPVRFEREFRPVFDSTLRQHLPYSRELHAIELGCIPGSHLYYLWKTFGYTVSGVDYCAALPETERGLVEAGAAVGHFLNANLFEAPYPYRYDVVFSAGLAEHFRNARRIVRLHAELAKPLGYVVIEVPNLRWLNYALRFPTDRPCLDQHVMTLMSAPRLARFAREAGLRVLFCDYVGTFLGINIHDRRPGVYYRSMRRVQWKAVEFLLRWVMWRRQFQKPSALWSPVTLLIARKP